MNTYYLDSSGNNADVSDGTAAGAGLSCASAKYKYAIIPIAITTAIIKDI